MRQSFSWRLFDLWHVCCRKHAYFLDALVCLWRQHCVIDKTQRLGSQLNLGRILWLSPAVCSSSGYLTSLTLGFYSCKTGRVMIHALEWRLKEYMLLLPNKTSVPHEAFFADVLLIFPPNYAWLRMQVPRYSLLN